MITAPTAPSEFGTSVDDLAAAYSPQELQKRYKVTKELVYLLALQKLKSEMDAAQRSLAMSQQQVPGTVKQQLESQVMQGKMQEASGIMSQMPQMMQRQPQMAAQGGIVGYQGGGQKAGDIVATEEDIASNLGGDVLQDILSDPVTYASALASLGLRFVPGLGLAITGAQIAGKVLPRLYPSLRRIFRGKPKQEIIEPKTQKNVFGKQSEKKDLIPYDPKKDPTRPVDPGKQLAPRKPTPPSASEIGKTTPGLAGIAGLMDEEEVQQEQQEQQEQQQQQQQQQQNQQDDSTKPAEIKMRPPTDFQGTAQEKALRVKDLSPALVDSLEAQAAMTPEQMTQRRDAEAQRYLDKIGAKERTQGLQDLYDEQVAVLEAQADPDELRRRRQLAFFSNIGTGGIGSILRGGGRGLMKETEAQRKEARDAAQTKMTSYQSVHNFDISMIKDAEDKGLAILQLDRLDKRNAQTALSNISRQDLASINSYADRLRASEDSRIQEQFQKLELLQDNYENLRKDERLDYATASELYTKIMETEAAVKAAEIARLPDDVRVLMLAEAQGEQLSATEKARVDKANQVIDMAIKAALNKMGVLDTKEALKDRVEAGFAGTRKSPVSPATILGVGMGT